MNSDDEDIPERISCDFCRRKFNPDSLLKHSKVCEKTLCKKRKVFDSAKQRIQGTELAEFLPSITLSKKHHDKFTPNSRSHSRWKENHIALIRIIKAARNDSLPDDGQNVTENRRPRISSVTRPFNQQTCIYCDRSFGLKSYDRHIEWCKEKSARIDPKSFVNQEAKERLEARVKYKAPIFRSRRSLTREKYAPRGKNAEEATNIAKTKKTNDVTEKVTKESTTVSNRPPTPQMKRAAEKIEPQKKNNFIRQNVLRCSYKSRLPDKTQSPKQIVNKADTAGRNNLPYMMPKDTHFNYDEAITATGTRIQPSQPNLKHPIALTRQNKNNETTNFINSEPLYDPYVSAELQMQQLMKENDFFMSSDEDLLNSTFIISSPILTLPSAVMTRSADSISFHNHSDGKMKNKENFTRSVSSNSSASSSNTSSKHDSPVKSVVVVTSNQRTNNISPKRSTPNISMSPTSAFSRYSPTNTARLKLPNMERTTASSSYSQPAGDSRSSACRKLSSTTADYNSSNSTSERHYFLPPVMSRSADVFDDNSTDVTDNNHHFSSGGSGSSRYPLVSLSNLSLSAASSSSSITSSSEIPSEITGEKKNTYYKDGFISKSADVRQHRNYSCASADKEISQLTSSLLQRSMSSGMNDQPRGRNTNNKDHSKSVKHTTKMEDLLYGGANIDDGKSIDEDRKSFERIRYDSVVDDDRDGHRSNNSSGGSFESIEKSFLRSVSDFEKALECSNLDHPDGRLSVSPPVLTSSYSSVNDFKNLAAIHDGAGKRDYPNEAGGDGNVVGRSTDMVVSKASDDSAYNSLYQLRSPINEKDKMHNHGEIKLSIDSGINSSKSSTPFVSRTPDNNETVATIAGAKHKLSKFCHECGAKYPVAIAKFCCECGVRRLVL